MQAAADSILSGLRRAQKKEKAEKEGKNKEKDGSGKDEKKPKGAKTKK